MYPDIQALDDQLSAVETEAQRLLEGLTEETGTRQPTPGAWSVAEGLEHLAVTNRIYLEAMTKAAAAARAAGRLRRGPARAGVLGRIFVWILEPPVKGRAKAPGIIVPRPSVTLADASTAFLKSQREVHAFLNSHGDLDLTSVRFRNPFIPGVRFSLATALCAIAAHERRHLWQAWRARKAM